MIRSSVSTKPISRILDIGDLRSGNFCDLPIRYKSMGNKLSPLYLLWRKHYLTGTGNDAVTPRRRREIMRFEITELLSVMTDYQIIEFS